MCVTSPEQARLCELEDQVKASKKGMWSEGGGAHTIRDLKYTIENPRNFVDSLHQKPINGKEFGRGLQATTLVTNASRWHVKYTRLHNFSVNAQICRLRQKSTKLDEDILY